MAAPVPPILGFGSTLGCSPSIRTLGSVRLMLSQKSSSSVSATSESRISVQITTGGVREGGERERERDSIQEPT